MAVEGAFGFDRPLMLSSLFTPSPALDKWIEAPDAEFGNELQHRVGGYPSEIQNSQVSRAKTASKPNTCDGDLVVK